MQHKHEFREAAQELTCQIIQVIEATGKLPYQHEWDPLRCIGPQAPVNAFTGEPYHGSDALFFGMDARALTSGDPRWATFTQAADEHCHVRKGAKSILGIFYKPLEIEDEKTGDGKRVIPLLKTFHAFDASEIEGLPPYKPPTVKEAPWTRPDAVTALMKNSGITYRIGGDTAFYSPAFDIIQMPPDVAFPGPEILDLGGCP